MPPIRLTVTRLCSSGLLECVSRPDKEGLKKCSTPKGETIQGTIDGAVKHSRDVPFPTTRSKGSAKSDLHSCLLARSPVMCQTSFRHTYTICPSCTPTDRETPPVPAMSVLCWVAFPSASPFSPPLRQRESGTFTVCTFMNGHTLLPRSMGGGA